MYLRDVHADASIPMLRKLIYKNPLGIFTTAIRSEAFPLIQSSHIPFVYDVQDPASETELGVLRGHMARQNPQSKAIIESLQSDTRPSTSEINVLEEEVLVLFNSPVSHYVTPKFYTETKPYSGKVVPTWNYAAVQAYGRAKIYYESKSDDTVAFLFKQINDLSQYAEQDIMGFNGIEPKPRPWQVSDAPEKYISLLRTNIIGIEIQIDRLEGKFKMSQEMSSGDREGVVKGFKNLGTPTAVQMAEIVQERGDLKDLKKAMK